jgi:WD40 repeat protein
MAPIAFVSYAREDQPFVRALVGALEPRREIAPVFVVESVALSPDGEMLAAASGTGVGLWSLADPGHPALVATLSGPTKSVSKVAFSPDGSALAAGGQNGATRIWDLDVDAAIQRICATTSGALTSQQWKRYFQTSYPAPCAHPGRYGLLTPLPDLGRGTWPGGRNRRPFG